MLINFKNNFEFKRDAPFLSPNRFGCADSPYLVVINECGHCMTFIFLYSTCKHVSESSTITVMTRVTEKRYIVWVTVSFRFLFVFLCFLIILSPLSAHVALYSFIIALFPREMYLLFHCRAIAINYDSMYKTNDADLPRDYTISHEMFNFDITDTTSEVW